jgi:flagellar biosynthesis GTPase FlhF
LDEVVGLGVVLNVVQKLQVAVSYLSTGQNVPNDLQEACRERLAELLSAADNEGGRAVQE